MVETVCKSLDMKTLDLKSYKQEKQNNSIPFKMNYYPFRVEKV